MKSKIDSWNAIAKLEEDDDGDDMEAILHTDDHLSFLVNSDSENEDDGLTREGTSGVDKRPVRLNLLDSALNQVASEHQNAAASFPPPLSRPKNLR